MGSRLSLFSRSPAKVDDKEVTEEVKAEVTPKSEPTPITSDITEEPKCQCVDCKCDPCNCRRETSQDVTTADTHTKAVDQVSDRLAEVTLSDAIQTVEIHQKPNEVNEPSKDVQNEEPEVPQQVQEIPEENIASQVQQEVVESSEEVKEDLPVGQTTENKCLCSPCKCDPCKCGGHEVVTEGQTQEVEKQSEESPQEQSEVTHEESAAPQPESQSPPIEGSQGNGDQTQTEPNVEERRDCEAEVADNPDIPPEVSQVMDLQTSEQ